MESKFQPVRDDHIKTRDWRKISIISVFIVVLGLLVYTSFFGGSFERFFSTGKAIDSDELSSENAIEFYARLNLPQNPSFSGELSKIQIQVSGTSEISSGDNLFELSQGDTISIENYEGNIIFNENNIFILDGDAERVIVNGIPVSSREGKSSIYSEEMSYKNLNIFDIYISSLNYKAAGLIDIEDGRRVILLRDENILIENFKGDLTSSLGDFILEGVIGSISVEGDHGISISSKSDFE